jgi:hypothetical protein
MSSLPLLFLIYNKDTKDLSWRPLVCFFGGTRHTEVLTYPKPSKKRENKYARSSREPETHSKGGKRARKRSREPEARSKGGKQARKKFPRTRNPLKRWKTSTQEVLTYPKPTQKVENEHARGSREPETHSKGGKRARKKFSRTQNPLKRWKTCTREVLTYPKPAQKRENVHAKRSACSFGKLSGITTQLHKSTQKYQP